MTNNRTPDMPEEIFLEPKPATWGAMLFSDADPKNGRAVRYVRADLIKPEPAADLNKLKIAAVKSVCGYGDADDDGWMHNLVAGTIDYLAAQGHLRPAVPREDRIAKLEEALRDIASLESRWGFYLADAVTIARKALE